MRQGVLNQGLGVVWRAIRLHHPEVPEVVIVVASGTESRSAKWGHWAASRWSVGGDDELGEVLVAGERFQHGPTGVLETLLHEAAHALAHVRGVKDTSRNGRYHNKRYKRLAEEVGLTCMKGTHGFNRTDLGSLPVPADVAECECGDHREPVEDDPLTCGACGCALGEPVRLRYAAELGRLAELGDYWRRGERKVKSKGSSRLTLVCGCEDEATRRIQVAPSIADLGSINCGVCFMRFEVQS